MGSHRPCPTSRRALNRSTQGVPHVPSPALARAVAAVDMRCRPKVLSEPRSADPLALLHLPAYRRQPQSKAKPGTLSESPKKKKTPLSTARAASRWKVLSPSSTWTRSQLLLSWRGARFPLFLSPFYPHPQLEWLGPTSRLGYKRRERSDTKRQHTRHRMVNALLPPLEVSILSAGRAAAAPCVRAAEPEATQNPLERTRTVS
ncbi:hypothetical protein B0H67DRAFT_22206 [Lasiosphaeris hirsuta]|uniref:Uncharacterized protein n=1 Tax=Lasiosphaeris hirsuta TaxID=260670 RepID=A0AA40E9H9_9PEZI|nr:hypothetical protein B0H67DRAFT_22206 [Lasiosphaeris hirsuta]